MRLILIVIIACLVYFQGVKPIIADRYFKLHKSGDKTALAQAFSWAPDNTLLQMESGQILKALETSNGDITAYATWYYLATLYHKTGNKSAAIKALNNSLYFYPHYEPAKELMGQISG